jgi:hypothetical protein
MKKSELKALIKETIEDVKMEAKVQTASETYTFNQLNNLLKSGKVVVLIKLEYGGELVAVDENDGFFMQENEDGDKTVHTTDGRSLFEYGAEFDEVYVAKKVNIK